MPALRARKSSGVSGEIMPQSYTTEGLSVNRSEALSPAVPVQRPLFRRSAATYNPWMKLMVVPIFDAARGVVLGRQHSRCIGRHQRSGAYRRHAGVSPVDLEFQWKRRAVRRVAVSVAVGFRVGVGSRRWAGRIRRHLGIGGPAGVAGVRRPDISLRLFPGERIFRRNFDAAGSHGSYRRCFRKHCSRPRSYRPRPTQ